MTVPCVTALNECKRNSPCERVKHKLASQLDDIGDGRDNLAVCTDSRGLGFGCADGNEEYIILQPTKHFVPHTDEFIELETLSEELVHELEVVGVVDRLDDTHEWILQPSNKPTYTILPVDNVLLKDFSEDARGWGTVQQRHLKDSWR